MKIQKSILSLVVLNALLLCAVPQTFAAQNVRNGIYDGPVVEGKPEGTGLFVWWGGMYEYFHGSFSEGKIDGEGSLKYRDGRVCEGEFNNQLEIIGQAKCEYVDGSIYIGPWKNNKPNGKGVQTTPKPPRQFCLTFSNGLLVSKRRIGSTKNC